MAFEFVAGHAVNNLVDFSASKTVLEARDGPSTVNLFVDATDAAVAQYPYAASVVEACASHTIYALRCTAGADFCEETAPIRPPKNNLYAHRNQYILSDAATVTADGVEGKATGIENCELDGTTAATCTITAVVSVQGRDVSTSRVTAYTDAASLRYDVSITGAPSSVNTRAVALWGFLGAVVAVGVVAI
ncbi:hypothetical protein F5Y12DRAFT_782847 [Xylaria sp. FL1777]|nr:hypothetical protein F5Y12DRAFT_782847 [Xylaria sp. FL1777]